MQKYNGRLIYQEHDDDGILEVVEANGIRSLHFGTDSVQSGMLLSNMDYLQLSYSRAMMSWHLYRNDFENTLMIGLGGGSLVKYLLRQFSKGNITVLEQRKSVVKIARSHFSLPFDARLKIITGDGGKYIRNAAVNGQQYDLLLVDAFDDEAMSSSICNAAFFDACRLVLTDRGIMAINLWNTDRLLFEHIAMKMNQSFDAKILFLPVRKRGNIIAFCFPRQLPNASFKLLHARAIRMESVSGIEYPLFLTDLNKNNPQIINRISRL